MKAYILKRMAWTVAVVIGITMLTFFLLFVLPGDPAEMLAISKYGAQDATNEAIETIKIQEGLNRPIPVQYALWLSGVLTGDLGKSRLSDKPVWESIVCPASSHPGACLYKSSAVPLHGHILWDHCGCQAEYILGLPFHRRVADGNRHPQFLAWPDVDFNFRNLSQSAAHIRIWHLAAHHFARVDGRRFNGRYYGTPDPVHRDRNSVSG